MGPYWVWFFAAVMNPDKALHLMTGILREARAWEQPPKHRDRAGVL